MDEVVQAKEASRQLSEITPGLESQIEDLKTGGQPLPGAVRAFFEPRFGYDFSNVRIHTEVAAAQTADQMHALAYTVGPHIVFGPGQYAPNSSGGTRLLAHELTHVVQQAPRLSRMQAKPIPSTFHKNNGVRTAQEMSVRRQINLPTMSKQTTPDQIHRHTKEDCDAEYETCCDGCRRLPPNARKRRALCWAACMAAYAACLATSQEALTFAAIVAAIVLAAADGPLPFGDAAAAALLISLGITGSSR